VSLDPPLVLVCMQRRSVTLGVLLKAGFFSLSVLDAGQTAVAQRFAHSSSASGWMGLDFHRGASGAPMLDCGEPSRGCQEGIDMGDRQLKFGAALAAQRGFTLRETVLHYERTQRTPFAGSARTVADQIGRWFTGRAADGFIMHVTVPSDLARFADEVLPILRDRGLFRTDYESDALRGNLGLPIPANVHSVARVAAAAELSRT
jgi:hypothetical protein